MTIRDIFSLMLKFLGFYFIWYVIYTVFTTGTQFLSFMANKSFYPGIHWFEAIGPGILAIVAFGIGAYILLSFSEQIAQRLIPVDKEIGLFGSFDWQKEIFILALRIFGVLSVVKEFPRIVFDIVQPPPTREGIKYIIYELVLLAIGLYLVTGAKHIAKLIFREKKSPK
jgi:hypothetical protein